MSVRAVPFYCPYCAEQTIQPSGEGGSYYCTTCDRRFRLAFEGLGEPD
jgi:hypothetical protein